VGTQTEKRRQADAETLKEVMRKLKEALRLSLELERTGATSERG
jgi:predicted RNase H-like HicB family nuclease